MDTPEERFLSAIFHAEESKPMENKLDDPEARARFAKAMKDVLDTLADDQRTVLDLRYGLSTDERKTHEETAASIGKSVEEVKELEAGGLTSLRSPQARALMRKALGLQDS